MQTIMHTISENKTLVFNKPITTPFLIPVIHASTPNCVDNPFMVDGKSYGVTALSLGSPHGVVMVDNLDDIDVSKLGLSLGTHPLFPKGANIVFVQIMDKEALKARLWPQDGSETAYTFEAACAAGTAAMMLRKVSSGKIQVCMGAHSFQVEWDKGEGDVRLTESRAEIGDDYVERTILYT